MLYKLFYDFTNSKKIYELKQIQMNSLLFLWFENLHQRITNNIHNILKMH